MLGEAATAHSNNKPCPCLPSSRSHFGLLITALDILLLLLLTSSNPCPPQTNILGGRILIITASEKSDCLLLKWPIGHAGPSLSFSLVAHLMTLYSHKVLEKSAESLCVVRRLMRGKSHAVAGLKSTQPHELPECTQKCMLISGC